MYMCPYVFWTVKLAGCETINEILRVSKFRMDVLACMSPLAYYWVTSNKLVAKPRQACMGPVGKYYTMYVYK